MQLVDIAHCEKPPVGDVPGIRTPANLICGQRKFPGCRHTQKMGFHKTLMAAIAKSKKAPIRNRAGDYIVHGFPFVENVLVELHILYASGKPPINPLEHR